MVKRESLRIEMKIGEVGTFDESAEYVSSGAELFALEGVRWSDLSSGTHESYKYFDLLYLFILRKQSMTLTFL